MPLLTVATVVLELYHDTFLLVALDGETVAVSVSLSPVVRVSLLLLSFTDSTLTTFAFTVTLHSAVLPPSDVVTLIVEVPDFIALTTPLFTVTTEVLELVHITFLFVALDGESVAVSVSLSPAVRVSVLLFSLTDSTLTTFAFTVTLHSAVLPPSDVVTLIVEVPDFTALTMPSLTVAMEVLELVHDTFLLVALDGETVAVNDSLSPSVSVTSLLSNNMWSTGICSTSTWQAKIKNNNENNVAFFIVFII